MLLLLLGEGGAVVDADAEVFKARRPNRKKDVENDEEEGGDVEVDEGGKVALLVDVVDEEEGDGGDRDDDDDEGRNACRQVR